MYGSDLLVAPVLEPHATSRRVHLPAESTWTDLTSGEVLAGGRFVNVDAPRAGRARRGGG
ncbi:TIM-barrel domain-containing protein [Cellulomonas sp. KRMCY2]|uniref:TIM-barrel domain-containing protein n=1 Tax=Cellulomonas sp. KRMCY2 TaxID=1304865 RepID=UPI00045E88E9|nr:TIM-barrel domain-containing protein [Cellulomonas sp. KRMCY2]